MGQRMLLIAFFPTNPHCHGNEIWDKMDYNSTYVQYISEIKSKVNLCRVFVHGETNQSLLIRELNSQTYTINLVHITTP